MIAIDLQKFGGRGSSSGGGGGGGGGTKASEKKSAKKNESVQKEESVKKETVSSDRSSVGKSTYVNSVRESNTYIVYENVYGKDEKVGEMQGNAINKFLTYDKRKDMWRDSRGHRYKVKTK